MKKVRWGVLSTARIGVVKVIPAMQAAKYCDVTAIASRDEQRASQAAADLGIAKAYGTYSDLLADPDIDAVYNPLPNHMHAEWTIAALAAGKHVLCEKPLAVTAAEAQQMAEQAEKSGRKLMEAFMYRLHPQWVQVRDILASGRLGELITVQSFFAYRNLDPVNIRNILEYGGGAILDIGCYCINASRMLFGTEPDDAWGITHRDKTSGVDILSSGVLKFGDRHATFTCATQVEPDQRVHVVGTKGRLLVEIPFNIPWDQPTRLLLTQGGEHPVRPNTEVLEVPAANMYTIQGSLFSKAILDNTAVPIPLSDALHNMAVIETILKF